MRHKWHCNRTLLSSKHTFALSSLTLISGASALCCVLVPLTPLPLSLFVATSVLAAAVSLLTVVVVVVVVLAAVVVVVVTVVVVVAGAGV